MDSDLRQKLEGMEDGPAKADLINRLAVELREKDPRGAIDLCDQALELSSRLEYQRGLAEGLRTRGNCYLLVSDNSQAMADELAALRLFRALGDEAKELRIANIIGNIHRRTGDLKAAASSYSEVLKKARETHDRLMQASALNNLGNVNFAMNLEEEATVYYQQALVLFREMGEVHYATMTLINLSSVYRTGKQFQEALDCCRQALAVFPEYSDRQAEAATWFVMGLSYRDMGQKDRAIEVWQKSIDIAREVGDMVTEMSALVHTAEVLADPDHIHQCLELLGMATLLEPRIGDRKVRISLHQVYATACDITGDTAEAEDHRNLWQGLAEEIERLKAGGA
jgi:tetratricopeptide (TPR) repeat protein